VTINRAEQGQCTSAPQGLGLSRRSLLQAGLAVASAALLAMPAGAALAPRGARLSYYKVFVDREHAAAQAFGRASAAAGLPVQSIDRDVTSLWYHDLYHVWRRQPVAIAGMTPVRTAFCLQLFAQDAGLRMVYRTEHRPMAGGGLEHHVIAPAALARRCGQLDVGAAWADAAAGLVQQCPAELKGRAARVVQSAEARGFAHDEPLVSWVIAPVPARHEI
jgi:hypothetical protein